MCMRCKQLLSQGPTEQTMLKSGNFDYFQQPAVSSAARFMIRLTEVGDSIFSILRSQVFRDNIYS